ncbi:hypothetical protein [Allocoleopsis sp.]
MCLTVEVFELSTGRTQNVALRQSAIAPPKAEGIKRTATASLMNTFYNE